MARICKTPAWIAVLLVLWLLGLAKTAVADVYRIVDATTGAERIIEADAMVEKSDRYLFIKGSLITEIRKVGVESIAIIQKAKKPLAPPVEDSAQPAKVYRDSDLIKYDDQDPESSRPVSEGSSPKKSRWQSQSPGTETEARYRKIEILRQQENDLLLEKQGLEARLADHRRQLEINRPRGSGLAGDRRTGDRGMASYYERRILETEAELQQLQLKLDSVGRSLRELQQ